MYCCKYNFATLLASKYNLKFFMSSLIPDTDTESLSKVGKITVEVLIQMLSKVLIYLMLMV